MSAVRFGVINLIWVLGAALLGLSVSGALPEGYLSPEIKDPITLTLGLISTMTAMLLGLLIASAKSTFDNQQSRVIEMAALVSFLDRTLVTFGPASSEARRTLKGSVEQAIERLWPQNRSDRPDLKPFTAGGNDLHNAIQSLVPQDNLQEHAKALALESVAKTATLYALIHAQSGMRIPPILLRIVTSWLGAIFFFFGLLSPQNAATIAAIVVSAMAVSTAQLLVSELDSSFGGIIGVSGAPLRNVYEHLSG